MTLKDHQPLYQKSIGVTTDCHPLVFDLTRPVLRDVSPLFEVLPLLVQDSNP